MEIKVKGMSCSHCTAAVEKSLKELGLNDVSVDLETGIASFKESSDISLEDAKKAIIDAGYEVE